MNLFDVKYALEHITILVDTREQNTERSRKRLAEFGFPYERKKLDFGDYSVRCELEDGTEVDLSSSVAVERKMNLTSSAAAIAVNVSALRGSLSGQRITGLKSICSLRTAHGRTFTEVNIARKCRQAR